MAQGGALVAGPDTQHAEEGAEDEPEEQGEPDVEEGVGGGGIDGEQEAAPAAVATSMPLRSQA